MITPHFTHTPKDIKNALTAIKAVEILGKRKGKEQSAKDQAEYQMFKDKLYGMEKTEKVGDLKKFFDTIEVKANLVLEKLRKNK